MINWIEWEMVSDLIHKLKELKCQVGQIIGMLKPTGSFASIAVIVQQVSTERWVQWVVEMIQFGKQLEYFYAISNFSKSIIHTLNSIIVTIVFGNTTTLASVNVNVKRTCFDACLLLSHVATLYTAYGMAIRVVEFSSGVYKIENIFS